MKIVVVFTLLILNGFVARCQGGSALQAYQQKTVYTLRVFRDELNKAEENDQLDSLLDKVTRVINITKNIKDTNLLSGLQHYFSKSYISFTNATASNKSAVVESINNDMSLKLARPDSTTVLYLGEWAAFGKVTDLQVTAFINGAKQTTGQYRVYWAIFRGDDQVSMITSQLSDGSSDNFSNPYLLQIPLPGYVTFWLEDVNNKKKYKSDFIYKKILTTTSKIDISFLEVK